MTPGPIRDQEILNALEPLASERSLALAVSGGADSTALMLLARRWQSLLDGAAPEITVLTVDHGLRAESPREARQVERLANEMGLGHATLQWRGAKPSAGLQAAARNARYDLLTAHCQENGIGCLVTAHHLDDQAETLLMRLARGSGVDGLAAIPQSTLWAGVRIRRPLLDFPKSRLIFALEAAGQPWLEDPGNRRQDFERNRIRKVLDSLERFGFARGRLALTARRMRRAQEALDHSTENFLKQTAKLDRAGFVTLDGEAFRRAPEEVALRGLGRTLMAVGGLSAPPRLRKLEAAMAALRHGDARPRTLAGCRIMVNGAEIRLLREPGRTGLPQLDLEPGETGLWDRRFRVAHGGTSGRLRVCALGQAAFADLRRQSQEVPALPADAGSALVSFWRDRELVAVPHLALDLPRRAGHVGCDPALCTAQFVNGALLGSDFAAGLPPDIVANHAS